MSWLERFAFWRPVATTPSSPVETPSSPTSASSLQEPQSSDARRSMSPFGRIRNWLIETPSETSYVPTRKTNKRKQTPDEEWTSITTSKAGTKKQKLCPSDDDEDEDDESDFLDLEGSTLVPVNSPVNVLGHPKLWSYPVDVDANDDTIVVDSTIYLERNIATDHSSREAQTTALLEAGWPATDVALFKKLSFRGFEPLLPSHWEKDFQALPSALFTSDIEKAFIKTSNTPKKKGADFRASKALEALLELGPKVRDRVTSAKSPEGTIKRAIEAYVKWSMADVGMWKRKGWTPVVAIEMGKNDVDTKVIQDKMKSRLLKLRSSWEHALADSDHVKTEVPRLYGVVISHTIVGIFSYVTAHEMRELESVSKDVDSSANPTADGLRTISWLNMFDADYDVWNSFALAILAIHSRNIIVKIAKDKDLGQDLESVESKEDSDLDA